MAKSFNSAYAPNAASANAATDPAIAQLRIPPHSIEAEQSVLGGLLLDNAAFDRIADVIGEADFYRDEHRRIYRQIQKLLERNKPVDVVTVAESLDLSGEGGETGGLAYLGELAANTPSAANIKRYAEIVRERAVLRQLVTAGDEIAGSALNPLGRDPKQLLDEAEAKVFAIAEGGFRHQSGFVHINPLLTQVVERIQELHDRDNPSDITGVPTGYHDLDELLLGLQPSTLSIVAARPGQGKTSFALGAALHCALDARKPVIFFSMEMGHLELTKRLLAAEAQIDARKLSTGRLSEHEWPKLNQAVGRLAEAPFFIDDNPHCTVMEMRAKARRTKARYGDVGLIVVDYLQLMTTPNRRSESRQVEVSELSRGLKILARELDAPVMTLSQLNRQLEYRQDKRPMLADLRESGSIEQDADVVIFIYRDDVYNPESEQRGMAEIIVAKHRNGPTGTTRLAFLEQYTKFANLART